MEMDTHLDRAGAVLRVDVSEPLEVLLLLLSLPHRFLALLLLGLFLVRSLSIDVNALLRLGMVQEATVSFGD